MDDTGSRSRSLPGRRDRRSLVAVLRPAGRTGRHAQPAQRDGAVRAVGRSALLAADAGQSALAGGAQSGVRAEDVSERLGRRPHGGRAHRVGGTSATSCKPCGSTTSRNGRSSPASESGHDVGDLLPRAGSERPRLDSHLVHHADEQIRQQRVVPAIVAEVASVAEAAAGEEDRQVVVVVRRRGCPGCSCGRRSSDRAGCARLPDAS